MTTRQLRCTPPQRPRPSVLPRYNGPRAALDEEDYPENEEEKEDRADLVREAPPTRELVERAHEPLMRHLGVLQRLLHVIAQPELRKKCGVGVSAFF